MRRKIAFVGAVVMATMSSAAVWEVRADPLDVSPPIFDCTGPAPDVEEGTPEYDERDRANMYCSQERKVDRAPHPSRGNTLAYRNPSRFDGVRWRYELANTAIDGSGIAVEVFRPCAPDTCALPAELTPENPPYPVVIMIHGFVATEAAHWWSAETLAEAGYLVVNVDTSVSTSSAQAATVLDWVLSDTNQFASEIDRDRVGMAGHSQGGSVSASFQGDERVSAIVAWDGGTSVSSEDETHVTPTLYQVADYTTWPGYPVRTPTVPNTVRASGFQVLRDRGVDTMVINARATTHLDWVDGSQGNRYSESMFVYYNIAWFDRYLKGKLVLPADADERGRRQAIAHGAFNRLTADVFDDSADIHNISQGFWDPVAAATSGDPLFGGNVPYEIVGRPVADRLSFYYRSVCSVSVPDYSQGSGRPGEPRATWASTTPGGTMRTDGCRGPVATTITYTGPTSVRGAALAVSARLVDEAATPVAGEGVVFTAQGQTATAITNDNGEAETELIVEDHGRETTLTVSFLGTDTHLASEATATLRWGQP